MRSLVIDTNVIIYHLRGRRVWGDILEKLYKEKVPIYVSVITEMELFAFNQLTVKEQDKVNKILETIEIIPLDSRLARIAAYLKRQKKNMAVSDLIIAATAKSLDLPLLTNNIKDFKGLKGVEAVNSIDKL